MHLREKVSTCFSDENEKGGSDKTLFRTYCTHISQQKRLFTFYLIEKDLNVVYIAHIHPEILLTFERTLKKMRFLNRALLSIVLALTRPDSWRSAADIWYRGNAYVLWTGVSLQKLLLVSNSVLKNFLNLPGIYVEKITRNAPCSLDYVFNSS